VSDRTDWYPQRRRWRGRHRPALRHVWNIPRTWSAGELVTSLMMNQHVRDNENALKSFIQPQFTGLMMRTHPDADKAANQVQVPVLTGITMNDGIRYQNLTLPLTADITVAGAGGLDTGSRTASAWYEAHIIGKSSTQSVNDLALLLHRAKYYTQDQSYTTSGSGFGLRSTASVVNIGQKFTPGTTGVIERAQIQITKVGAPTGRIWLTLQNDNAGVPGTTILATSDKLDVSKIATAAQEVAFVFRAPASFTSGTNYWIVVNGDYTVSNVNYANIGYDSATGNGTAYSYNGTTWTQVSATAKMWFKEFVTQNNVAPTLPLGYDEYLKLGYVYNNGSNVLSPFYAVASYIIPLVVLQSAAISTGGTLPTLTDWSTILPPGPVIVDLHCGLSASGWVDIGGLPDGYGIVTGGGRASGGNDCYNTTGLVSPGLDVGRILTEYQLVYLNNTGGTSAYFYNDGYQWVL
jgi:hypothetical protein